MAPCHLTPPPIEGRRGREGGATVGEGGRRQRGREIDGGMQAQEGDRWSKGGEIERGEGDVGGGG